MMTYEKLMVMVQNGDALVNDPAKMSVTDEGLIILGSSGPEEYCSDIRILIEPTGFRFWTRDPKDTPEDEAVFGKEWTDERFTENYDLIVDWAYSL